MPSLGDVKRRIGSVKNTKQITNAMNLVSASKLQKAKQRVEKTTPYFNEMRSVVSNVVKNSKGINHPFLAERDGNRVLVITITSDRGLCGGYNVNISKEVLNFINDKEESLFIVGNKGREYFSRRNKNIVGKVNGISEMPSYEDARMLGEFAVEGYNNGDFDAVYVAYTEFKSTISHEPSLIKLLPVDTKEFELEEEETEKSLSLMKYDPSEEEVLTYIVPKYINTVIFGALVASSTCEQAARMTSMDAATENANEVIDSLTLVYNRARQGAITQEITEIVSGANALE